MLRLLGLLVLVGMFSVEATAQGDPGADVPDACSYDADGKVDLQACFNAAEPQSGAWFLAAINLGSKAFWNDDVETAAHYYDLSSVNGKATFSDIILHANRASVFRRVGRLDDSLTDARMVWEMVRENRYDLAGNPLSSKARFYALMLVVQTFHEAGEPEADQVIQAFLDTPIQSETDIANQTAILTEVGHYEDALKLSSELLATEPDNARLLNNHCYLLTLMGKPGEGLQYCQQAVEADADRASFQHSLSLALAGVGRCDEAQAALGIAHELEPSVTLYTEEIDCAAN